MTKYTVYKSSCLKMRKHFFGKVTSYCKTLLKHCVYTRILMQGVKLLRETKTITCM
jgi:hypothetical protein